MKMNPAVRIALTVALALLGAPALPAQAPLPPRLPEPLLRETPWGDFPLERLLPGARLRFTSTDGERIERQVVSLGDSTLELLATPGDSTLHVSFTALHAYRSIEVRALPRWSRRVGPASVVGGALLGAIAGAIIHNSRKPSSAAVHRPGRLDDIAGAATVGGLLGWEIGGWTLGRPRWR
ncbi:MAG TPA: hypothetical protein VF761_02135, partial [Gemmatimonadaceae bacterium]